MRSSIPISSLPSGPILDKVEQVGEAARAAALDPRARDGWHGLGDDLHVIAAPARTTSGSTARTQCPAAGGYLIDLGPDLAVPSGSTGMGRLGVAERRLLCAAQQHRRLERRGCVGRLHP